MTGSKFSFHPRLQRPPKVCKKVVPPPIPPPTGCSDWPNELTWDMDFNLDYYGIPVIFSPTMAIFRNGDWNYDGNTHQNVTIDGWPWDVDIFLDFHGTISTCIFFFQCSAFFTNGNQPDWATGGFDAGPYIDPPGPPKFISSTITQPWPGTLHVVAT